MTGVDGLRLGADGYLDMEVYGAGPELGEDEVLDLRDALLADPVDEPTADEWTGLVDGALGAEPALDGPFALDDIPAADGTDDLGTADLASSDADDTDADDAGSPELDDDSLDVSDTTFDADPSSTELDWALDGGEADLEVVELDGGDDLFPDDGGQDVLPEVVPDIEDLL